MDDYSPMNRSIRDNPLEFDVDQKTEDGQAENDKPILSDQQQAKLLNYLLARLDNSAQKRLDRISRFARIDQQISTWQRLSPEDSIRDQNELVTGKSQAIPMNLPVTQAYIDDAVSFYAEVFAPIGGNFYTQPGKKATVAAVKVLSDKMNQDSKINRYYTNVCTSMRALNKYNFGGFHVYWTDGNKVDQNQGNVVQAIDVYNFLYDESIPDVKNLYKDGEWAAMVEVKNRLWLIRQNQEQGGLMNLDRILSCGEPGDKYPKYDSTGKAKYYKKPSGATRIEKDGSDTKTTFGQQGTSGDVDWDSLGLGFEADALTDILGYEITLMYAWINPNQFDLGDKDQPDTLALYRFSICDGKYLIDIEEIPDAVELPIYTARLNQDEMQEAARSIAEYIRPFQRLVSFLINTHIDAIRSNIWGLKGYDPDMFDMSTIKNGEVAGLLKSKKPGKDVRAGLMQLNSTIDTTQNLSAVGSILDLMKIFFPNQAAPSQIAGMDRAVSSQVSAFLQGVMRKMQMFIRNLDSALMQPTRQAQYRNLAMFDPDKGSFKDVKPEEVADILSSGLGQINREAAAEQVRTLLFALIQNPAAAGTVDVPGLYTLWSSLLNIGTDLGDFILTQTPQQGTPVDPNTVAGADPNAAAAPGAVAAAGVIPGQQGQ